MPFSSVLGANSVIKPGVCTSTTRPTVPYEGQLIYETDTDRLAAYNGSAWVYETAVVGPPGLIFIKNVSFSAAADSGTNFQSIFTSDFVSYKIVCSEIIGASNNVEPRMTFYKGTNTEHTANYYSSVINASYLGTSSVTAVNNGAYTVLSAKVSDTATLSSFVMDIHNVGVSGRPTFQHQFCNSYDGAFSSGGGLLTAVDTYTGLKFFVSSGNIAMKARVYGYAAN